ncbi:MAG: DEAD/DEAH box helicase [Prevotella sp.]|nr:DEAD/DEAH box helicase [Prevotella sp.]
MLPLQQAREVRDSVIEYIKATFRFKEKDVSDAFYRFIEDKKNGLFKGPYVSLKTPFVSATKEESENIPLDITPSFPPYKHQLQAFRQLSMKNGHKPEPTLLTTGTGSGKTECFLYPILDYCYHCNQYERQTGVKVIIMYPMNALASDQAKRLAETIWNDPRLKGKVTAGLFVGEGVDAKEYPRDMAEDHIIENRDAILDTVPDILLTNFKMLDYGLMRQRFMSLWKGNIDTDDKALRFIVLDELHTYDGAQGTDVANLIRRLKLKLNLPKASLCPVGTSATIGSGEDSKQRLCEYAKNVFGERFDEKNVIEEHRIPVDEYIDAVTMGIPDGKLIKECVFGNNDTVESYIKRLCKYWLKKSDATPVEAGQILRRMGIVRDLLNALKDGILTLDELQNRLEDNAEFRRLRQQYTDKTCNIAIENLMALIAYAKRPLSGTKTIPMLYLQVQLWQRELSGVLRYVQKEPEFTWRGSLKTDEDRVALPMYFCRDCGASGWISRRLATDDRFCSDVRTINMAFASKEKEVVLLNTEMKRHEAVDDYISENAKNVTLHVKMKDLTEASVSDSDTIRLRVCSKSSSNKNGNQKFTRTCPECNGGDTICQIGGRTSTLSSVAISQVLSSDFDNANANDRKILVFTNSVQDAAHQAGFYEARTFRFLFRQSMQKYINTLPAPINLVDLQKGFKEYWHEQLTDEEYYNRFLPADLAKSIDLRKNYRVAGEGSDFMESFKHEFELRVDWEILSEFALAAQLGRTLEKTGASASFFKPELLSEVHTKMTDWLKDNAMERIGKNESLFIHFIYGVLQRMRTHGAVDHPYLEKYRKENLNQWALNWQWDGRHFLNKQLGGSMQFPKLVGIVHTGKNHEMLDMAVMRGDSKQTWYSNYFIEVFEDPWIGKNSALFNDFMRKLLDTMVEVGLLNMEEQGGGNYAIRPENIWISNKVKHIQCDTCQSRLCVAVQDTLAEGTHCLDYKCKGTYSEETKPELNYYQQVYNRNLSPRVHAHEHTGLLERHDREELEKDFKQHPHSNSTNVLSATSTLEMGIDIGDLNVMGNTNVPPKPSNFLQRVGRAGRKEGSALVLNYAHAGEPHDMYYYEYPLEMMQGEVNTPGCFLEAKDILRRHFLAYCIDTWTTADVANTLPSNIRDLHLLNDNIFNDEAFILNRIIAFIKNNRASLRSAFCEQYEEKTQPALGKLFETLDDGTFYNRLISEFAMLTDRLHHLGKELDEFNNQKKRIQANDPALKQIDELIKATKKQYGQIMSESMIEYMTNVGLLPNYAFPETGVKLQANVYASRAKEDKEGNVAEPKTFELTRSASQGIKELAPGNNFYTQKYKLNVSGLNTFDWKDSLTVMKFCSKCDCVALKGDSGFEDAACPKCNDPSWGVNRHQILKFTGARSIMHSNEAALDDSSEDRDNENYIIKRHYMFHHTGATTSYAIRGVGFGIEFCNNMELYEVNYGMQMQSGSKVEVDNDSTVSQNGFVTCRFCGKSTPIISGVKVEDQHYKFCTHKDTAFAYDKDGNVFETLYLYRQMQTEAIKILLPIQIMDAKSAVEMFKAGIELGMKAYYKSSPEHIRIDSYTEMNLATMKKDHYLVMYDTIPGGTGYLSKLYSTEEFSTLLRLAYDKIHDCQCQWEGKDGCYHCILTYGNQYKRDAFSREAAEALFEKLISHANSWEPLSGSVGTISQTGVAEDSELELKFIGALKTISRNNGWEFEKVADADSYRYDLHIIDGDNDLIYYVIPQFALGGHYGVRNYTVADFQIICMAAKINGMNIERIDKLPMWSIFLDGYTFHAKAPNMRFYSDKAKRDGIHDSTTHKLYSWTLTWEDIQLFENEKEDSLGLNNMNRLIELLKNPQPGYITETAFGCIANTDNFMGMGGSLYQGEITIDDSCYDTLTDYSTDEEVATALDKAVRYDWHLQNNQYSLDKDEWTGFWRRYNLLQFFSNKQDIVEAETMDIDRDEIKMFYPELEDIVDMLIDNNIAFGYEGDTDLTDADGIVLASAGMLLRDKKVAINPSDEHSKAILETAGYKILYSLNFNINDIINI